MISPLFHLLLWAILCSTCTAANKNLHHYGPEKSGNEQASNLRKLTLSILPYLSGSCEQEFDGPFAWGYFFDDSVDDSRELFTFQALSQPHRHPLQREAAKAAVEWLHSNQQEVFQTIFLLNYQPKLAEKVSLDRVDPAPSDDPERIYVILREKQAPITTQELVQLRENVMTGGDTWDGGDFGSFRMGTCQLRLTLCFDRTTDWVGLPTLLWPPPQRECQQPSFYGVPQFSTIPESGFQIIMKALLDWWWPVERTHEYPTQEA
jgi:hypothetical protein